MSTMLIWSPGTSLEDVERQVILKAFDYYKKVKTTTAVALGISVRTLDTKLEKYEAEESAMKARLDAEAKERRDRRERHRFGTLARAPDTLDAEEKVENENETRRKQYAIERAEGRRNSIEVAGQILPLATGVEADAGVHVESTSGTSAQQSVPMQQRAEVQKVLSPQASVGGTRNRR